jgi:hypothetical protein
MEPHQAQYDRLEARIDMLYTDRLDGADRAQLLRCEGRVFRAQQQAILRKIHQIQATAPVPVEGVLDLMRLTSKAATLFCQQNGHEQRRLLRTLVKSAAWQGGELRLEFEEPFEILRGSNRANRTKEMQIPGSGRDFGSPNGFRNFNPMEERRCKLRPTTSSTKPRRGPAAS